MARQISWNCGPANSRFARVLYYFGVGVGLGVMLYGIVDYAPDVITSFLETGRIDTATLSLLVALGIFAVLILVLRRVAGTHPWKERSGMDREWRNLNYRPWGFVTAILFTAVFLLTGGLWLDFASLFFACGLTALGLFAIARMIATAGTIDPDELTFSTGDDEKYDLTYLREAECLSLGNRSAVLLLFARQYNDRKSAQDVYVLPDEVADRAMPVFESSIEADIGEPKEHGALRRVNVSVVGAGFGLVGLAIVFIAVTGSRLRLLLQVLYGSVFFLAILTKALIRSL